ncbi:hypothetical protein HYU95_03290 [Candidatus Daviesbacteria bacterium]|nr:hypothetical protein [Candidatus Daviesbacteria bacterium]
MSQIRLNKTPELAEVLAYLRSKYLLLSEAEIIKVALAEKYSKEVSAPLIDEATEKLIAKGLKDYKNGRYTVVRTDKDLNAYLKSL